MKALYFLFFFLIFVIAVLFSLKNLQPVAIDFYYVRPELPLALALTLELLAGVIIGFLVGVVRTLKLKSNYARLAERLVAAEKEVEKLRVLTQSR